MSVYRPLYMNFLKQNIKYLDISSDSLINKHIDFKAEDPSSIAGQLLWGFFQTKCKLN